VTPYQFLNANNQSLGDLSYNDKAKAYIDSLLANPTITHNALPIAYARDENGHLTNTQAVDENGKPLYQVGSGEDVSFTTNPYDKTYLNGYEVSPAGENRYSVGIDDPTTRGLFDINAEIDPTTNKLKNLGTTYNSHTAFDWSKPAMFAALVAGGLLAAPLMGGAALAEGGGAAAGGALAEGGAAAGDAFLPGALATTDAGVASGISADLAAQAAGTGAVGSGVVGSGAGGGAVGGSGLGTGTAYSADAATNPLNPFYGTAQASPTSLGLVSGGGGSTIGEGSIIGSGAGLGQTVPASVFNVTNALNMAKIPSTSSTPQKQMANALRLPTNLSSNVTVKPLENPFLTNNQQVLANMLKV
jgi:hypothetical protein